VPPQFAVATGFMVKIAQEYSEMPNIVEDIEKAITQLPQEQLLEFRAWYEKFDSDAWDAQIARDASAGKLDALADAAIAEHRAGKTKAL